MSRDRLDFLRVFTSILPIIILGKNKKLSLGCDSIQVPGASRKFSLDLLEEILTINKMKRQPMNWEKTFANDVTDKGLISKIYKQLIQFNNKKQTLGKGENLISRVITL